MELVKQPRLSVAILARNCAEALRQTIDSVRPVADEIVVLDTGSTDDTPVAALQAGAAVQRRAWDDDFAAARNACLAQVTGDWVLWLDAGETLAAEQRQKLREFLADSHLTINHAYLLTIALPAAVGQIGGEEIARVRLHLRRAGLQFAGRVRESLDDSLARLEMTTERLPVRIERSLADHDPAMKLVKAQRNIHLADLQLTQLGSSADLHNCLGEAFAALADPVRAAQQYRRALELSTAASREQLEAYYGLLTSLDGALARSDQLALCMQALERFPLDAQLLVALGGYLQGLGHRDLAIRAYDVAFRHGQIEPRVWHLPEIHEIAAGGAAAALMQAGRAGEARTLLEAAVRSYPESPRFARQLAELSGQQATPGIAHPADRPLRWDGAESPAGHVLGKSPVSRPEFAV